jgi:septal ring factor EnvC (AmiA/AmiB activator)
MDNNEQDFVKQMVNDIREDLKDHRKETREDINKLREQIQEVKSTVDINHNQLVRVESQLTATDAHKSFKVLKQQVWAGFLLVFVTVGGLGISWYQISSERHQQTVSYVQDNRQHMDETAEQTLQRARQQSKND